MAASAEFKGFPKELFTFYEDLAQNNDKEWFEEHRAEYEKYVLEPARAFVEAMGRELRNMAPEINADPRVNRSLFKIFRDTRFSKDKTPFKTHLALWFWEGAGPRMECSGFYVHLEPGSLMLGAGIYQFPKHLLDEYRRSVVHKRHGPALAEAVVRTSELKGVTIGGAHYKRTPRGFDPDHKNAEWLLYNGLYAGLEKSPPAWLHKPTAVDKCLEAFAGMLPLHVWLLDMTRRA